MKLPWILAIGALVLAGSAMAQQYYRWVDEDGVVHFSQQPPPDVEEVEQRAVPLTHLTAQPMQNAPAEPQQMDGEETATEDSAGNGVFGRDEQMCNQVQQSLATMRANEVVNMTMADGEIVQVHGDSRQAEINRLLSMQDYYC